MKSNKLIVIGWIGIKICYLNIDKDEAIRRYLKSENMLLEEFIELKVPYSEFYFDDEFNAYEVWEE